jgi:hypothetical protein
MSIEDVTTVASNQGGTAKVYKLFVPAILICSDEEFFYYKNLVKYLLDGKIIY